MSMSRYRGTPAFSRNECPSPVPLTATIPAQTGPETPGEHTARIRHEITPPRGRMTQPLEERLSVMETVTAGHEQMLNRLITIQEHQDQTLDNLAGTAERLLAMTERLETNQAKLQSNQERLETNQLTLQSNQERLEANQATLQSNQERQEANLERLTANQETLIQILAEVRRDTAATQRLWTRLAQRYNWLDDEQNGAGPDPQD